MTGMVWLLIFSFGVWSVPMFEDHSNMLNTVFNALLTKARFRTLDSGC